MCRCDPLLLQIAVVEKHGFKVGEEYRVVQAVHGFPGGKRACAWGEPGGSDRAVHCPALKCRSGEAGKSASGIQEGPARHRFAFSSVAGDLLCFESRSRFQNEQARVKRTSKAGKTKEKSNTPLKMPRNGERQRRGLRHWNRRLHRRRACAKKLPVPEWSLPPWLPVSDTPGNRETSAGDDDGNKGTDFHPSTEMGGDK